MCLIQYIYYKHTILNIFYMQNIYIYVNRQYDI